MVAHDAHVVIELEQHVGDRGDQGLVGGVGFADGLLLLPAHGHVLDDDPAPRIAPSHPGTREQHRHPMAMLVHQLGLVGLRGRHETGVAIGLDEAVRMFRRRRHWTAGTA